MIELEFSYSKDKKNKDLNFHLYVDNDSTTDDLRELIKSIIKGKPSMSGLDFDVTKLKKGNNEELEEGKKIENLKSKDVIFFDLKFNEFWLNIEIHIEEVSLDKDNIFNNRKNMVKSVANLQIKMNKNKDTYIDSFEYILVGIAIDFFDYKPKEKNLEQTDDNIEENTSEDGDYYLLYKKQNLTKILTNKNINLNENNFNINNNKNLKNKKNIEMKEILKKDENDEKKEEKNNIFKKGEKIDFTKYEKIKYKFSFINFTNYIIKEELLDEDENEIERKKNEFNKNFLQNYLIYTDNIYRKNRILCLLKSKEKEDNINNINDIDIYSNNLRKIRTSFDFNRRKKQHFNIINYYNKKIENLKPLKLDRISNLIELNVNDDMRIIEIKDIVDNTEEIKNSEEIDTQNNNTAYFNNLKNNNNDKLKKIIFMIIIITLFLLILIKIF